MSVVDFYERSGICHMILLGGEPGLHSRFMDIIRFLSGKNFSILVGTTGALPELLVESIVEAGFQGLKFALNSTSYFEYERDQRKQVDHFLFRLGRRSLFPIPSRERSCRVRESSRSLTGLP